MVAALLIAATLLFLGFRSPRKMVDISDVKTEESQTFSYGDPILYTESVPDEWQAYQNRELGISLKYPSTMEIRQPDAQSRVTVAEEEKISCDEPLGLSNTAAPWISFSFLDNQDQLTLENFVHTQILLDRFTTAHPVTLGEHQGFLYSQHHPSGIVSEEIFMEVFENIVHVDWHDIPAHGTILSSVIFSKPDKKNMYELESQQLIFYDFEGNKHTILNNVDQKAGVSLMEFFFPAEGEKIYFSSYTNGSDSPWGDLYEYTLSTGVFRRMNISNFIRGLHGKYLSPDAKWLVGYNEHSQGSVGTKEVLYVFDFEKDELRKEINLESNTLTFMEACWTDIADYCWGSEIQWIDNNIFEYNVFRTTTVDACKGNYNFDFPLFETRRNTVAP